MIPYNRKMEKNGFEIIFGILKYIYLVLNEPLALFALLEILWILFVFEK